MSAYSTPPFSTVGFGDRFAQAVSQVEHTLSTRELSNPRAEGEGHYRFLCSGDVESFRELGTRFLQMPLGEVERVAARGAGAPA